MIYCGHGIGLVVWPGLAGVLGPEAWAPCPGTWAVGAWAPGPSGPWVWALGPGFWALWPLGPWSLGPGGLGLQEPGRPLGRGKTRGGTCVLGMSVKAFWALL